MVLVTVVEEEAGGDCCSMIDALVQRARTA